MKKFWKIFPIQFGFSMIPLGLLWLFFVLTLVDSIPQLLPASSNTSIIGGHIFINLIIGGAAVLWLDKIYKNKKINDSTRLYLIVAQIIWTILTILPLLLILKAETTGMGVLG